MQYRKTIHYLLCGLVSPFLLICASCANKYADYESMKVDDREYRPYVNLVVRTGSLSVNRNDGVSSFKFYSGEMYNDATEELFCYSVSFAASIVDSVFVNGKRIPFSENYSNEEWFINAPGSCYQDRQVAEASMSIIREWGNRAESKAYDVSIWEKEFIPIEGWLSFSLLEKGYKAEYQCLAVAPEDGEIIRVKGEYY